MRQARPLGGKLRVVETGLSIDLADIRSRARAAFLGVALGDALGATVEFMTPGEIRAEHGVHREIVGGGWLRLKPGRVTDDTEMSLCIAQALDAAGGWSLRGIADNFAKWMKSSPTDVGNTVRHGIRGWMVHGRIETPPNAWDAGNGAAMRMLPVALFTLGDDALLARCAVDQGHITHNHPFSDAGCVALGRMVHQALLRAPLASLRAQADALVAQHPNFAFEPYRGNATGYIVDTLQTVFHHFFATRSFEECLVAVVNQGHDSDTTGAIAGMIAGAFYGRDALPGRWLEKLDPALIGALERHADRLVALSPQGRAGV